jgi:hypothetical protein
LFMGSSPNNSSSPVWICLDRCFFTMRWATMRASFRRCCSSSTSFPSTVSHSSWHQLLQDVHLVAPPGTRTLNSLQLQAQPQLQLDHT